MSLARYLWSPLSFPSLCRPPPGLDSSFQLSVRTVRQKRPFVPKMGTKRTLGSNRAPKLAFPWWVPWHFWPRTAAAALRTPIRFIASTPQAPFWRTINFFSASCRPHDWPTSSLIQMMTFWIHRIRRTRQSEASLSFHVVVV